MSCGTPALFDSPPEADTDAAPVRCICNIWEASIRNFPRLSKFIANIPETPSNLGCLVETAHARELGADSLVRASVSKSATASPVPKFHCQILLVPVQVGSSEGRCILRKVRWDRRGTAPSRTHVMQIPRPCLAVNSVVLESEVSRFGCCTTVKELLVVCA